MGLRLNADAPEWGIPGDFKRGEKVLTRSAEYWHFPRNEWEPVWDRWGGKGIKIAILDTGVSPHPNLPTPIAHRSFINGQSAIVDRNGHGTHCTGTALARDGVGAANKADLIAVKVLSDGGSGGSDGIARGIRYAADQGADIISMSLGGGNSYGPTNAAIDYAWSLGCLVIAAAGNSGFNGANTVGWPAKYRNCLCCGATRRDGQIANFSSGGRELDLATPGEDIVSCDNDGSGFVSLSGTSMATPWAAGLFANIIQAQRALWKPSWRAADAVRAFGERFTDDRGQPGKDVRFGFGVPNIPKILEALTALGKEVRYA